MVSYYFYCILQENDAYITGHSTNEVRVIGLAACCLCLAIVLIGMEWEAKVSNSFLHSRSQLSAQYFHCLCVCGGVLLSLALLKGVWVNEEFDKTTLQSFILFFRFYFINIIFVCAGKKKKN